MKFLDHVNIIKLHETIETRTHYYIITEIVKNGDLFDHVINQEFLEGFIGNIFVHIIIIILRNRG